jgi:hypothetical protein
VRELGRAERAGAQAGARPTGDRAPAPHAALSLQRAAGNRAVRSILRTPADTALTAMKSGANAWGLFKAWLDPLLFALKHEPNRTEEATRVLNELIYRVYNSDFKDGGLRHPEIGNFLLPQGRRIGSLIPATTEGLELMKVIVTVLTMTSGGEDAKRYNAWGDDVFAMAVGAVGLEQRSSAIAGKTAALEKRKARVPRGLVEEHAVIDKRLAELETEYNRLYQ